MTPTHAISADEARRLLEADRRAIRLRQAKDWFRGTRYTQSPYWESLFTPFGEFTYAELTSK